MVPAADAAHGERQKVLGAFAEAQLVASEAFDRAQQLAKDTATDGVQADDGAQPEERPKKRIRKDLAGKGPEKAEDAASSGSQDGQGEEEQNTFGSEIAAEIDKMEKMGKMDTAGAENERMTNMSITQEINVNIYSLEFDTTSGTTWKAT